MLKTEARSSKFWNLAAQDVLTTLSENATAGRGWAIARHQWATRVRTCQGRALGALDGIGWHWMALAFAKSFAHLCPSLPPLSAFLCSSISWDPSMLGPGGLWGIVCSPCESWTCARLLDRTHNWSKAWWAEEPVPGQCGAFPRDTSLATPRTRVSL